LKLKGKWEKVIFQISMVLIRKAIKLPNFIIMFYNLSPEKLNYYLVTIKILKCYM